MITQENHIFIIGKDIFIIQLVRTFLITGCAQKCELFRRYQFLIGLGTTGTTYVGPKFEKTPWKGQNCALKCFIQYFIPILMD